MKRAMVVVALVVAAVQVAGASAAAKKSIPLKVGDAIDVVGTKIACFAINSSAKDGIACVLWKSSKAMTGSYGVGLAVDGNRDAHEDQGRRHGRAGVQAQAAVAADRLQGGCR